MIGKEHSGCLLEQKLGAGGMGTVYLATRKTDGRRVAVKFLPPDQASYEPWRRRFVRTAELVQGISHPNIAKIVSIHGRGNEPHVVMEWVKGEPLDRRLRRKKKLSPPEAIRICRDIARGLEAAHRCGIVHRDIKPGNILLTPGGKVKIIDFGLGKNTIQDEGLTFAGQVLGTPSYMAPEQWGAHEVDARCDIFSLGSTLYHLATGKLAFTGRQPAAVMHLISQGDFLAPRSVNPDLSEELELVLYRMMEVDRELRYQSMELVAEDLQRLLEGRYPNIPRLEEVAKGTKHRYALIPGRRFKIGRKSLTCDLVFADRSLSREHAEIERVKTGFLLRDLDSRSGTFVRNSRVKEVTLKNNDTLRLGKRTFVFKDGLPDLASSSYDEDRPEREEVLCVSEPMLRALTANADRRVVLTLMEQLAPGALEARVQATYVLINHVLGEEAARAVSDQMAADLAAAKARIPGKLFLITHEKLDDHADTWLAWWDKLWTAYPTQVGPNLPPLLPQPRLRLTKGGDKQHAIDLSSGLDFLVGRENRCDIQIKHGSVSRVHATILRLHERMAIRDESSRLGTIINGERTQISFLKPGDKIHLGRAKLVFETRLPQEADKPPSQAGAFPVDPRAFEVLVELRHPSTIRSLVAFLRAEGRLEFVDAEANWLLPQDRDLRKQIIQEARQQYRRQAKRARDLLPQLIKTKKPPGDAAGWKELLVKHRRKIGPQVMPTGWSLPI